MAKRTKDDGVRKDARAVARGYQPEAGGRPRAPLYAGVAEARSSSVARAELKKWFAETTGRTWEDAGGPAWSQRIATDEGGRAEQETTQRATRNLLKRTLVGVHAILKDLPPTGEDLLFAPLRRSLTSWSARARWMATSQLIVAPLTKLERLVFLFDRSAITPIWPLPRRMNETEMAKVLLLLGHWPTTKAAHGTLGEIVDVQAHAVIAARTKVHGRKLRPKT